MQITLRQTEDLAHTEGKKIPRCLAAPGIALSENNSAKNKVRLPRGCRAWRHSAATPSHTLHGSSGCFTACSQHPKTCSHAARGRCLSTPHLVSPACTQPTPKTDLPLHRGVNTGPLGCFPTIGSLLQGALGSHRLRRQHPPPSSLGGHFGGGFYPRHPFWRGFFTPLAST